MPCSAVPTGCPLVRALRQRPRDLLCPPLAGASPSADPRQSPVGCRLASATSGRRLEREPLRQGSHIAGSALSNTGPPPPLVPTRCSRTSGTMGDSGNERVWSVSADIGSLGVRDILIQLRGRGPAARGRTCVTPRFRYADGTGEDSPARRGSRSRASGRRGGSAQFSGVRNPLRSATHVVPALRATACSLR